MARDYHYRYPKKERMNNNIRMEEDEGECSDGSFYGV